MAAPGMKSVVSDRILLKIDTHFINCPRAATDRSTVERFVGPMNNRWSGTKQLQELVEGWTTDRLKTGRTLWKMMKLEMRNCEPCFQRPISTF